MFGGKFGHLIRECEVFCFEPDFISGLIRVRWCGSCCLVQGFFRLLPFLHCLPSPVINKLDRGWWIRDFCRDSGGIPQKCFYWGDACCGIRIIVVHCCGYREPIAPIVL